MSLDKAILYGKEHRNAYRGAKRVDRTCRNHGSCDWCLGNRMYRYKKRLGAVSYVEMYDDTTEEQEVDDMSPPKLEVKAGNKKFETLSDFAEACGKSKQYVSKKLAEGYSPYDILVGNVHEPTPKYHADRRNFRDRKEIAEYLGVKPSYVNYLMSYKNMDAQEVCNHVARKRNPSLPDNWIAGEFVVRGVTYRSRGEFAEKHKTKEGYVNRLLDYGVNIDTISEMLECKNRYEELYQEVVAMMSGDDEEE